MFQMKKSLFAVVALAAAVSSSQALAGPGFNLGLMGGAGMTMTSTSGVDGGIGISAGATAGIGPIEASLLYTQYQLSATVLGVEATSTLNYLDVPVLFRMGVGPLSVGLGGFYSMFLSGSATAAGVTADVTDAEANYGATASVRFTLPIVGLFADARYNLGLKDDDGTLSSAALLVGWNFL